MGIAVFGGGRFEESVLIGFSICLRILEGVLALRERREIETWLAASKLPLILPKDHAAARLLGSVSFNSESSDLLVRAKALEVVGLVFGDALENENEAFALRGTSSCEARMRRFMDMVTIGELEGVSIELLANTCGCSPRHANRVFRRCFGGSLHDTQAEIQQKRNSVFPLVEFL